MPIKKEKLVAYLAIVVLLGAFVLILTGRSTETERAVACTADAMVCPDGSSVGRVGPNCEFAPCPAGATPTSVPPPAPAKTADLLSIGGSSVLSGVKVTLRRVVLDSRCPKGVACIQAGSISAEIALEKAGEKRTATLALDSSLDFAGIRVSFVSAAPYPESGIDIPDKDYRLRFTAVPAGL